MSYEGSDDEEEPETVSVFNQNNKNYTVVSDSKSESEEDECEENLIDDDIEQEVKATPNTTINDKMVQAIKKLQASYSDDANKTVKQATQEKCVIKNSNFLINLARVSSNTNPSLDELKTFNEAWNHFSKES